ncbi:hypothetical protein BOO92_13700 [Vibrio navarrensis]|uniref:HNH endonuclease signature motif containing protein n=1 Tax=Vibrio TaxID=662 RepID=UPI001868135D|nr:HNH endonuclease [Vibrio navarrensis]EHA1127447.1 HNH endonuclease [Vibrio navarrensis]MBE3657731.1 hypothetical protein [Vibrio navarrensis]MBH9739960.1 hypothetical protein [Vibrio navarrensis]HAS6100757.1 hypothetical protein [Vibrio vulnificus]
MGELYLGVSRSGTSRALDAPTPDGVMEFEEKRGEILNESGYKCKYCGLVSLKYQHVHHKNGDHRCNEYDNLECCDPLCHLTQHLKFVANNGMGTLVLVPQLTQAQLNTLQRISWVLNYRTLNSKTDDEILRNYTLRVSHYISLIERTSANVLRLYGFSEPQYLANIFLDMDDIEYFNRQERYPHIRILFNAKAFSKEIHYWATEEKSFNDLLDHKNWLSIAKNFREQGKQQ